MTAAPVTAAPVTAAPAPGIRVGVRPFAVLLIAAGLWTGGGAGWIHLKAWLAQVLIEQAWAGNLDDRSAARRPWSWADTSPIARIEFVRQEQSMIVLAGESGWVLAFGPGHRPGSALPGEAGNSVVSGHRDTHFAVLQEVALGDLVQVQGVAGGVTRYRVDDLRVVDEHDLSVTGQRGLDELTLVTCWPFQALVPGGPLRYVVSAGRIDERHAGPAPPSRGI